MSRAFRPEQYSTSCHYRARSLSYGDRVSIESKLTIQVGDGHRNAADSIYMTDIPDDYGMDGFDTGNEGSMEVEEAGGSGDDFEIIE